MTVKMYYYLRLIWLKIKYDHSKICNISPFKAGKSGFYDDETKQLVDTPFSLGSDRMDPDNPTK